MIFTTTFVLLSAASTTLATSPLLAKRIAQPVSARGVNPAGGWLDTLRDRRVVSQLAHLCFYRGEGVYLSSECGAALEASPFCADDSWSLWFATKNPSIDNEQYGYFCCLPGQVGLMTADCVESDTVVAATLSASLIRAGSTSVAAPSSSTPSSSAPSSSTPSSAPASGVSTALSTVLTASATNVSTSSPPSSTAIYTPNSISGGTSTTPTSTHSFVAVAGTSGADASKGIVISGGLGGLLLGIFAIGML